MSDNPKFDDYIELGKRMGQLNKRVAEAAKEVQDGGDDQATAALQSLQTELDQVKAERAALEVELGLDKKLKKKKRNKINKKPKAEGETKDGDNAEGPAGSSSSSTSSSSSSSAVEEQGEMEGGAMYDDNGAAVTPWDVSGDVDYDKLIQQFGCKRLTDSLKERMEKLTGKKLHRYLRRGIFFSHRDLEVLLDMYEKQVPFYLYTGRGPSAGSMHMGHMVQFHFAKYLQDAFGVPLVIQMTDDEKYLWKDMTMEEAHQYLVENIKDIIACGFDPRNTFIFSDMDYIQHLYPNICKIRKRLNVNQMKKVFGFDDAFNIGQMGFPAVQAAPAFASSFKGVLPQDMDLRCLVPCAIDQDPYFRVTRDVAQSMGENKPALIHSCFFPSLKGGGKMSSSEGQAIVVSNTPKQIKKIIGQSQSGGWEAEDDQTKYGANLMEDRPFQYLRFLLEDDDKLAQIEKDYGMVKDEEGNPIPAEEGTEKLRTGEVKAILIEIVQEFVKEHQDNRAAITDELVAEFMSIRPLEFECLERWGKKE